MESTVKERLITYLKKKGIGRNKFEAAAGISTGYITNLKSTPGANHLVKILTILSLFKKYLPPFSPV